MAARVTVVLAAAALAVAAAPPGARAAAPYPDLVVAGGAQHRVAGAPGTVVKRLIAHLAGTYDGREMTVFANGIVGASAPVAGRLGRTPSPLVIGGGLRGRLDDVAVYARALDEPTLTAHEDAGRAAPCPDEPMWAGVGAAWYPACWRPYLDGSP